MRICRIARQYPRASQPGALLLTYILGEYLPFPCLYIAKVLDGPPIVKFSDHVKPVFISYPEPSFPDGYKITKLQLILVAAGKALGSVILTLKAIPHILRFKPDLMDVHTPLPIAPALWAKVFLRKPIVLTFHGTDYYRFQKSRALQWMVRHFVDHVVAITPEMLEGFKEILPDTPVTYIPSGVDLKLFTPGGAARRKQFVALGRMAWQKGYDDLIKAMAKVVAVYPDYKLVLVGDGVLRGELETAAKDAGIADHVIFTGMIPQPEVVKILQESEVYVSSSVSEGFPKAILEGMACGLSVVTTDVGACGMVARDAGYVVPPSQPDVLADAMLKMIDDSEKRQAYAAKAVEVAQQYSWETITHSMQLIYESLVDTKHKVS